MRLNNLEERINRGDFDHRDDNHDDHHHDDHHHDEDEGMPEWLEACSYECDENNLSH